MPVLLEIHVDNITPPDIVIGKHDVLDIIRNVILCHGSFYQSRMNLLLFQVQKHFC